MDQRRQKRKRLVYYLEVFDITDDVLLGHMVDITTDGLMIVTKQPIESDKVFQLELSLPERDAGKEFIVFGARSVWCKQDVNPELYGAGFQFVKIDPEDAEIIEGLTRSEWFQD